jgi:membrane protein implicated in regulation of membrane protease activity
MAYILRVMYVSDAAQTIALSAKMIDSPIIWPTLSVAVLLVLSLLFISRAAVTDKAKRSNTDALIGEAGLVVEPIDSSKGSGQVRLGRELWKASSLDGAIIPEGKTVVVMKIVGCSVVVRFLA